MQEKGLEGVWMKHQQWPLDNTSNVLETESSYRKKLFDQSIMIKNSVTIDMLLPSLHLSFFTK